MTEQSTRLQRKKSPERLRRLWYVDEVQTINLMQGAVYDGVHALKGHVAIEILPAEHQGKPVPIVRPHVIERYLIEVVPLRSHLCNIDRFGNIFLNCVEISTLGITLGMQATNNPTE